MLGLAAVAVSLLVVDYFAYPWWSPIPATEANKGTNGLWIRYTHYFGEVPDEDVAKLATRLGEYQFAYAFFHVRFIKKDGTLAYRYPEKAKRLLETVRERAPQTKLIAWVFAGNERGSGEVDLTDRTVRENMVEEAKWLIEECGLTEFSGTMKCVTTASRDFWNFWKKRVARRRKARSLAYALLSSIRAR